MNMRAIARLAVGLLASGLAATAADLGQELNALRTRLESLGDRAIPIDAWNTAMADLTALADRAAKAGRPELAIEAEVLQARAWADMRHDTRRALNLLRQTRANHRSGPAEPIRLAFVTEAEMLARLGDADAVRRLILEFKNSPFFDPHPFEYRAGEGRNTPLAVRRPYAREVESLTLLSLEKYLEQARKSPGAAFPGFTVRDANGAPLSLADLKGRVCLIDFWVSGSVPWERNLPFLLQARRKFAGQDFEIVGVALNLDDTEASAFAAGRAGMDWRQVGGREARLLGGTVGLYGECGNYLLDREGRVRARNLQGAALLEAVGQLLGER